ncbi:MAG: hypothetical protein GXO00_02740 [Candidatus Diapherotrites archaeon]|nr:hypothetical protein [Candidatus Diapherotrites archaeon]
MRWWVLLAVLAVVALPFILYFLFQPQPGCVEGTLEYVSIDDREMIVAGKLIDVRGLFYEGNVSYTAWDLMYEANKYVGTEIRACYDDSDKLELLELNGRVFEKYEYE